MSPEENQQEVGKREIPAPFEGEINRAYKLPTSILELEPKAVWSAFDEISKIPRDSGKEALIREHLKFYGASRGWGHREDAAGNLVLIIPGKGKGEDLPPITLQAHMDMVCIARDGVQHDFTTDPITPLVGWQEREGAEEVEVIVSAAGTTLGADNGLGLAMALAVGSDDSLSDHPPLEILATVAEEVGLEGAIALDPSIVEGRILINLDTEEYGKVYISSAGGRDLQASWNICRFPAPEGYAPIRIVIDGLPGGHSGVEIHEGRPNAIHVLSGYIKDGVSDLSLYLTSIEGGDKLNAIPHKCEAIAWCKEESVDSTIETMTEHGFKVERIPEAEDPIAPAMAEIILDAISNTRHGVITMSGEIPGLVQTSNNVAKVRTVETGVGLWCKVRSSVDSEREGIEDRMIARLEGSGAEVILSRPYSGWKADPANPLVVATCEAYEKMTGEKPEVVSIHAGLECGEFARALPGVSIVSFGPTIRGAHTPDEQVEVRSVEGTYQVLKTLISSMIPEE